MTIVDDIGARIAAITQMFPALAAASARSAQLLDSAAAMDPSEFSSALASATNDPAFQAIGQPAAVNGVAAAGSGATGVTGADVVTDAKQYLGVPYRYGGTDPATGLDCSALVQRTYADLGISLPRTSQLQSTQGAPVASLAQAQPGDLVCFGSPATHIGIYAGYGTMVVAPHTGTDVQIQQITQPPSAIRRIVGGPSGSGGYVGSTGSVLSVTPSVIASRPAALAGPTAYAATFAAAEARYQLPAGLLSAVAKVESNYRPDAVSSAGAVGLMQLMPATAKALGVDPTVPAQAIDGAARLLSGELAKYGSVPLALAAYNAGGPAVDRYGGIPPFPETQNYVQKVTSYLRQAA